MNLNKLNDRSNAAKWAHPEIEDIYAGAEGVSNMRDTTLNPNMSFDERKAYSDQMIAGLQANFPPADPNDPSVKSYDAPGCPEEPDTPVHVTVYWPTESKRRKLPCIINLAGGGLTACMDFTIDGRSLADRVGAVVVVPKYRAIYSDGGYPETINDIHAAFKWIIDNAEDLGVNPDKILLYGGSTGGHLSLAACHRLKRYGYHGFEPRGCIVTIPIPDERTIYPSSKRELSFAGEDLYLSSMLWLGLDKANPASVTPEMFANHATVEDCVGLPPHFIHTGENDVSVDPVLQYVSKLIQAGVYTDLHVWGGSGHAALNYAELAPDKCDYAQLFSDSLDKNFHDAFTYDLRRQWVAEEVNEE